LKPHACSNVNRRMEGIPGSGKVVGAYIYRTYVMGGELDKMIERGSISTLKGTHLEPNHLWTTTTRKRKAN
jgi:hypothetical protein